MNPQATATTITAVQTNTCLTIQRQSIGQLDGWRVGLGVLQATNAVMDGVTRPLPQRVYLGPDVAVVDGLNLLHGL